jgi:transposase
MTEYSLAPHTRPAPSFARTVSAEIARQAQQHAHPPVAPRRRTPAEEAALAALLRQRQRGELGRESWTRPGQDLAGRGHAPQPGMAHPGVQSTGIAHSGQHGATQPGLPTKAVPQAPHTEATEMLAARLVPASLWAVVEPLIPPAKVRRQGGGRGRVSDRSIFTAIVFVLTSGCAWRHLPATFGVTVPTVHRRFQEWTELGLWLRLRRVALEGTTTPEDAEWLRVVLDAAERRATKAAG